MLTGIPNLQVGTGVIVPRTCLASLAYKIRVTSVPYILDTPLSPLTYSGLACLGRGIHLLLNAFLLSI